MKNLFTFLLLSVMAFSFVSCGDEDEVAACDTTQVMVDLLDATEKYQAIVDEDDVTCEEIKSASKDLNDFVNSNRSCIDDAIDAGSDTTEEAEEAKAQIDFAQAILEAALIAPCI
ncbi:hypothetical protein EI427_18040 [Flammeovirga pectinis]|uniref:Lipoprotein n=1 Tax=Flammeovirga pectinis TaxID=2494373 RepID=A0A3Q9FTF7_9BACT|nr:hypothetical protein [Flammeovirga pectinis]AZQ64059.1 hypothetical protein EI427_18040 [Flammeovirga pectinis]